VGKTTTKEMLRTALSPFGRAYAAVASYNNHWGLPLTLARTPLDAAFCVAEIGMNHTGEIAPLARLARPHVAVITAVEKAHVGQLGSIEAIADEKATIFQGLLPGGVGVLPLDSPLFSRLRSAGGAGRVVTFGRSPAADVRLAELEPDAGGSSLVVAVSGCPELRMRLHAPGAHMAMNAVATLAAVHALGLNVHQAARALEGFTPIAGRGARRWITLPSSGGTGSSRGTALLLDESYNGNGASMRAALEVLRLQPAKRRIAVLGDMLELGDDGPSEHADLAAAVIRSADRLFVCGPLMQHLYQAVPDRLRAACVADSAALARTVAAAAAAGDAILIKGSLGSQMKRVVDALDPPGVHPTAVAQPVVPQPVPPQLVPPGGAG
jgi:UDP-N-acetylmuramoyl-tripeptide--D-alanyl-D-alanine ligase